ncbi:MAG TPA: glycine--tRNA ligase subunit beta [bacterium]|nr:glycine--tRNA ligase subunit beta [bacterium]
MKKNDFLLELGVEDFPARFVEKTRLELKDKMAGILNREKITFENIEAGGSTRRFWILVKNLASKSAGKDEVIPGPPERIAYADGKPSPALEGFLKKNNGNPEDVSIEEQGKEKRAILRRTVPGRPAADILEKEIPALIRSLSFPKQMRWPESDFLFARPIRSILAFHGRKMIRVHTAGIKSGQYSSSLSAKLRVNSAEDYFKNWPSRSVFLKKEDREKKFYQTLTEKEKKTRGRLVRDRELLDELLELNENPQAVLGTFKEKYLALPAPVIVTVLRHHQKYFSFEDDRGRILPYFLAVIEKNPSCAKIVKTMERVVQARLEDALFFFKNDSDKNIDYFLEKLKGMIYQEKLGSLYDKTERIAKLTIEIARDYFPQSGIDAALLGRTALLSRFDLATSLVYEFPELEGTAGEIYALEFGETPEIASGIRTFRQFPQTPATLALFVADKIDTLLSSFILEKIPTGSEDPHGLRKEATLLLSKVLESGRNLRIDKIVSAAARLMGKEVPSSLPEFLKSRLELLLKDMDFSYDEVAAVLAEEETLDPVLFSRKLEAIKKIRKEEADFEALLTGFRRARNILTQAGKKGLSIPDRSDPSLFVEEAEKKLARDAEELKEEVEGHIGKSDYYSALKRLVHLRPDIDLFFDKILIMGEDAAQTANRLALLKKVISLFAHIGDLGRIVESRKNPEQQS